ncbi:hypothetical protein BC937DRAFT_88966 [Endogone sp. FLAS-F59071]|nr:hypothetical protein BC937DRAFT_88966 [Endogone sp. FLAS-F59071]|eukprot:RUS18276.1 hypothetical protein BC937DRAFT_88966 [Endogone sp. FLAS-F59071]
MQQLKPLLNIECVAPPDLFPSSSIFRRLIENPNLNLTPYTLETVSYRNDRAPVCPFVLALRRQIHGNAAQKQHAY